MPTRDNTSLRSAIRILLNLIFFSKLAETSEHIGSDFWVRGLSYRILRVEQYVAEAQARRATYGRGLGNK